MIIKNYFRAEGVFTVYVLVDTVLYTYIYTRSFLCFYEVVSASRFHQSLTQRRRRVCAPRFSVGWYIST